MAVAADYGWHDYVVGIGRSMRGCAGALPSLVAPPTSAVVGAHVGYAARAAYGGSAASVGFQHHADMPCELPGAPRSRARLEYCMVLEATGDTEKALIAGRKLQGRLDRRRACNGCQVAKPSGSTRGRIRRRGLPARRRSAHQMESSTCSREEEAPSRSRHSAHGDASLEDADS